MIIHPDDHDSGSHCYEVIMSTIKKHRGERLLIGKAAPGSQLYQSFQKAAELLDAKGYKFTPEKAEGGEECWYVERKK